MWYVILDRVISYSFSFVFSRSCLQKSNTDSVTGEETKMTSQKAIQHFSDVTILLSSQTEMAL